MTQYRKPLLFIAGLIAIIVGIVALVDDTPEFDVLVAALAASVVLVVAALFD
jgi:hypothetical protein